MSGSAPRVSFALISMLHLSLIPDGAGVNLIVRLMWTHSMNKAVSCSLISARALLPARRVGTFSGLLEKRQSIIALLRNAGAVQDPKNINLISDPKGFLGVSDKFGFTKKNELFVGRVAMLGFAAELIGELAQGGKGPLGQLGAYALQLASGSMHSSFSMFVVPVQSCFRLRPICSDLPDIGEHCLHYQLDSFAIVRHVYISFVHVHACTVSQP